MNILDIGRRGLGKSTLAEFQAQSLSANRVYFDPGDQFENVALKTSELDEFTNELENWPEDKPFVISYVPRKGSNVEAAWDVFARRLWEFTGKHDGAGSYVLIVDESHRLQSPQKINDMLDEFIRRAPRRERGDKNPIDLIQTTHYPQDLHRVSWGESDEIFFFNVFDRRALKAISDQFGEEIAQKVSELKTPKTGGREVLVVESETGKYRIIENPDEWYANIKVNRYDKKDDIPRLSDSGKNLEDMYGRL
jgi:hypothetical protein